MNEAIYSRSDPVGENSQCMLVAGRAKEAFTELFGTMKVITAFLLPLLSLLTYPPCSLQLWRGIGHKGFSL